MPPATASNLDNKLTGINDAGLRNAFVRAGRGENPDPLEYIIIRPDYYHRVAYPAAGSQKLTFFNAAPQDYVTNFPGASGLPPETPMWITGLRIVQDPLDLTGARIANGQQILGAAAPAVGAVVPLVNAEELRTIFGSGIVELRVNNRIVIPGVYGLYRFPAGGGAAVDTSMATNSATTGNFAAAVFNNGAPVAGNEYRFPSPYLLLPQKPIVLTLSWQALLTSTPGFTIRAELVGFTVQRRAD